MSDLPDLDTNNVSFVAYWNAIDDGGVGQIDPEETLTSSYVNSYDIYDNGVVIDYESLIGRDYGRNKLYSDGKPITVRVKTDGWFVAYLDSGSDFATQSASRISGMYDVAASWENPESVAEYSQNTLERAINDLQSELDNSGNISYNTSDVGLYNYQNESASNINGTSLFGGSSGTGGFSYTPNTTLYEAIAAGCGSSRSNFGTSGSFEGTTLFSFSGGNNNNFERHFGAVDMLANDLIPSDGTEYQSSFSTSGDSSVSNAQIVTIILWD